MLAVERFHRSRPGPEVVIDGLRDRLRSGCLADTRSPFVAQTAGHLELAKVTSLQEGDGLAQAFTAATLRARLTNLAMLAGGFDNSPTFTDIVANRLFDIHILAGLDGPDGGQGMPVIGHRDGDDVDVLVIEDATQILLILGGGALRLFGDSHGIADYG